MEINKRPANSFIAFYLNEKDKSNESRREISEKWQNLNVQEKNYYKDKYHNDLNNYHKSNKQILKAKKIKNKLIVPKQLRTPFHLFCRSSEDENRNNLKFMHSKWKSLSEEEKLPYIEKSKSDKQRFDEEYKEYLNQYLNLIYKNSITKDEKESTVANLLKLNEKYERRFIVKEISNMISIRMFLKKNKSRLLKNVIQRNKIVEKRNVFILEKSKNLK